MMYLRQILKAKRDSKRLPGFVDLLRQHARWKRYQNVIDVLSHAVPWVTIWTIDFLENYLKPEMRVFEYGGGGSTIFFANRVKQLVTIEHDVEWFSKLEKEMEKHRIVNCDLNYIPADSALTDGLEPSKPDDYVSGDPRFSGKSFRAYAASIDQFPDGHFDVVLIDGRARPSCMMHSISKIKKSGLLILDNADRPHYRPVLNIMMDNYSLVSDRFGPTPYAPLFTQTNIWKRIETKSWKKPENEKVAKK